jgi:cytochrome c oxidase cbb3-type subunit 2
MIPIPRFRAFVGLVLLSFLFTWMVFVVVPWMDVGHLPPIQAEGGTDITPWDKPNEAHAGERVYAANGCVYCHTQQVRADTSGADIVRGWGTAHDDDGKTITRRTYPRDYIWDRQVFLGNSRIGADLTNVADRYPSAPALYRYLYDPEIISPRSSMPAYRFLFVMQKISGMPSQDALLLTGDVVPTPQARALVAYLLSLKNAYPLPDESKPSHLAAGL